MAGYQSGEQATSVGVVVDESKAPYAYPVSGQAYPTQSAYVSPPASAQYHANGHGMPNPNLLFNEARWQHGIFDCFRDGTNCLSGFCCPCWRQALSGGRAGLYSCQQLFLVLFTLWAAMQVGSLWNSKTMQSSIHGHCHGFGWIFGHQVPLMVEHGPVVNLGGISVVDETETETCAGLTMGIAIAWIALVVLRVIGCMLRGKIRNKYGIVGSAVEDAFLHCCCSPCAITQEGYTVDALELGYTSPFATSVQGERRAARQPPGATQTTLHYPQQQP